MSQRTAGEAGAAPPRALSTRVLLLLLLAYVFNFIDRQIIGILAVPIKAELGLSDRQLGLMGGVAFALFYSTLALPIAWFADRKSRIAIISASVAVWSLFTALCGLAQNFWQLFLARMGVGIGEAGGVAPSYSLIADYFPSRSRARAMAFFSLGIPLGSALGTLRRWIASSVDWRAAFIAVGLAGLPIALLLRLFAPSPVRGASDMAPTPAAPPFAEACRRFPHPASGCSRRPASGSILGYGLSLATRPVHAQLRPVAWRDRLVYGSLILVGGMLGTWLGGVIGDRLGPRRPGAYAAIPAVCFLLAAPAYAAALFAPSLAAVWILFLIPQILGLAWLGPVITAIQQLVPPNMRATASASFLLINNFIGIGFGVYIFGEMSTRMAERYGDESLRFSILYGLVFYLLAATFYALAARRLSRDMIAP